MVQNPKGGGLDSTFGGGNSQIGGVQNTNKFLDKATWTLATAIAVLIIASNFVHERPSADTNINIDGVAPTQVEKTAPAAAEPKTNTEKNSDKTK